MCKHFTPQFVRVSHPCHLFDKLMKLKKREIVINLNYDIPNIVT